MHSQSTNVCVTIILARCILPCSLNAALRGDKPTGRRRVKAKTLRRRKMAVVVNGIIFVDGMPVGKANGIKEGSVIDLTYPQRVKLVIDNNNASML